MAVAESGTFLFLLFLGTSVSLVVGKPPHIVFMVADDLGWNDIGFNNPDMITPNLDKLAGDGIIFNHSYVQPVCSPTRSAFMTSYYPFRLGTQHIVIGAAQPVCVPLNKTFLPQVLKSNGYATHAIGKWHLGFCKEECTPNARGFDTYFGYYSSREDYYTKMHSQGFDFHNNSDVYWNANGTYSTYGYADAMEKVIANHDPDTPLFLYFPTQSVHEPLEVPDYYYNLYPNVTPDGRRIFSGMVTALDDVVGRLVAALQKKGIYDDTLIFFSADNGGWVPYHGNNYPLRGGKITIWEGGTRVPAFVHGKALKKTGVRFDGLMHAVDWFPTIVEAAGVEYNDPDRDGTSQWKAITTLSESPRTEMVYNLDNHSNPEQGHAAMRIGDYKLILGVPGLYNEWYLPNFTWVGPLPDLNSLYDKFKYDWSLYKGLFNLKDDPYEHVNLYWQLPDVVDKLQKRLAYYYSRMVPAMYPKSDPKSDPKNWGGAWHSGWC